MPSLRPGPQRKNERSEPNAKPLPRPVTQAHLDAGQSGALTDPAGGVALILQDERIVAKSALDALRALGEPVTAVHAGFASTAIVLQDGQELAYYWCDDGITLMALCDSGRAAEAQPQTVLLMDRATYRAYCAAHPRPDLEQGRG